MFAMVIEVKSPAFCVILELPQSITLHTGSRVNLAVINDLLTTIENENAVTYSS
jgi:hypothetical protein